MSPSAPNLTHKEAGNRVLMLARSDAQRTFIQTGDQQLKEAMESHYRTWRSTGAEETAKAAVTLQRESYQALKRKHSDVHPRILYTTITNGSIYHMSNNDPRNHQASGNPRKPPHRTRRGRKHAERTQS